MTKHLLRHTSYSNIDIKAFDVFENIHFRLATMLLRALALPAFSERVWKGRMFSVVRSSRNKQINQQYFPLPQHLNNKKVLLLPEPILKPPTEIKSL